MAKKHRREDIFFALLVVLMMFMVYGFDHYLQVAVRVDGGPVRYEPNARNVAAAKKYIATAEEDAAATAHHAAAALSESGRALGHELRAVESALGLDAVEREIERDVAAVGGALRARWGTLRGARR